VAGFGLIGIYICYLTTTFNKVFHATEIKAKLSPAKFVNFDIVTLYESVL
jgi:hypothetical protein